MFLHDAMMTDETQRSLKATYTIARPLIICSHHCIISWEQPKSIVVCCCGFHLSQHKISCMVWRL